MLPTLKKHKYILAAVLLGSAAVLYGYNNPVLLRGLLSSTPPPLRVNDVRNRGKLTAAVLLFAPSSGTFSVGDAFNVSLLVNASDQSINSAGGTVVFPSDKLEVTDVSKNDSIMSLWVQEPSFSNQDGTISFTGGTPPPGFIGLAGQIMTISFKVKDEGDAVINAEDAQVLANDGAGTNILDAVVPAQLTLVRPKIKRIAGDINGDGRVDLGDFSILLNNWGKPKNQAADLNGDGKVDAKDLSILLARWSRK